MRAELLLRVAADPASVHDLTTVELCTLLAEASPPAWVFEEAARRRGEHRVTAHLFSHPEAEVRVLEKAFSSSHSLLLDRLRWHLCFSQEPWPELADTFADLMPEEVAAVGDRRLAALLRAHLPSLCTECLREAKGKSRSHARTYSPLARFLLLSDFLHYLECDPVLSPNDLPVMAKVALALNTRQSLEPFLNDADLRVRRAAKERRAWTEN